MSATLILILAVIALVLAAIDEFRAKGIALTSWGVILLAIIEIATHVPG